MGKIEDIAMRKLTVLPHNCVFWSLSFYVYFIRNVKTRRPFYVGQTGDVNERIRGHRGWKFGKLLRDGVAELVVVEGTVGRERALKVEARWQRRLRKRGYVLL